VIGGVLVVKIILCISNLYCKWGWLCKKKGLRHWDGYWV